MQKSPFIEIDGNYININSISRIYDHDWCHVVIEMLSGKTIMLSDDYDIIKGIIKNYYKNS